MPGRAGLNCEPCGDDEWSEGLFVGGKFSANVASQAEGSVPFASGSLGSHCPETTAGKGVVDFGESVDKHCFQNINDDTYGNENSWIPQSGAGPYF
eukprot:2059214-Rhodomonas_salina.1